MTEPAASAVKATKATTEKVAAASERAAQPMLDAMEEMRRAGTEFASKLGFTMPKFDGSVPAMPNMDVFMTAHQKNVEAFFKAQATMVDGMQAVMQRQVALFQQTMSEAVELLQSIAAEKDPKAGLSRQVEASKKTFEKLLGDARELGDVVTKSQSEAFQLLNKRAMDQIEEIKSAFSKVA